MRPPIISRKHYVQFTEFDVASATVTEHVYAHAKAQQVVDSNFEVNEGSLVKALFIELWLITDSGTQVGSFVAMLEKVANDVGTPTISEMTNLDAYDNKKNILFVSQGILATEGDGGPTPVLRQWMKIPKGKQRMGLDDQIRLNIAAIGSQPLTGCSFATYKEYK